MKKVLSLVITIAIIFCNLCFGFPEVDSYDKAYKSAGLKDYAPVRAVTKGPEGHWFSYYDKFQFDPTNRYLLSMEADFDCRSPKPDDVIKIGMIDLQDNDRWIELAETRAWGWQQGCMLQWLPGSDSEIMFNDRDGDHFVCKILDVKTRKMRVLPRAVYHVSPDGKWGLSLNFERVEYMRRGYGYAGVEDKEKDILRPENSGIYKVNMKTGECKFLVSIAEIAKIPYRDPAPDDKHYFNHIAWNTDGSRFLFFHRWHNSTMKWGFRTRVFTADANGENIRILSDKGGSHFVWKDPDEVLIWQNGAYVLLKDDGSLKEEVILKAPNGHQSYLPGSTEWIFTDTYPYGDKKVQYLYLYHIPTKRIIMLNSFPEPEKFIWKEWRVDLHTRVSRDGKMLCCDSTHEGSRQMYLIDISNMIESDKGVIYNYQKTKPQAVHPELKKQAIVWMEAENSKASSGLNIDSRKPNVTSNKKILGIVPTNNTVCQWDFELKEKIKKAELNIRFAQPEETSFNVYIDKKLIGKVVLPSTPGWGYKMKEWKLGKLTLPVEIAKGKHTLKLTPTESLHSNIDFLAITSCLAEDAIKLDFEKTNKNTDSIKLSQWQRPTAMQEQPFKMGDGTTKASGWGGYAAQNRVFFKEFLPGVFNRTIEFKTLPKERKISWVITGPRTAINIDISADKVNIFDRYYDSFGFYVMKGQDSRHPEWNTQKSIAYKGNLKAVTIALDSKLGLSIQLNGKEVFKKKYLFDLSQHQLKLFGKNGIVEGCLLKPAAMQTTVKINAEKKFQKMIGFGGIGIATAYNQLSKEGKKLWWKYITEYNLLIQREYPTGGSLNKQMDNWDNLETAKAHYYGDNMPNGEVSDFNYNKIIKKLGGEVWFEFWDFPQWIGKDVNKYTQAMLNYCHTEKKKTGYAPDVVGIQNEITQSPEMWHEMTLALRKELDKQGFSDVKIHMSDHGILKGGIKNAKAFTANKEVWNTIDFGASHMYDYQGFFTNPDGYDKTMKEWKKIVGDKPFLSTELCINWGSYQVDSYRVALAMAQLYHKNLTITNASAICYCWTILNTIQPSYGYTRSLFVTDKENGFIPKPSSNQLRLFGAFSRYIKKDMIRVEAETNDKDLLISAYKGKWNKATVVALNRSQTPKILNLDWPGVKFKTIERVNPYQQNISEPIDKSKQIVINPAEIITITNVDLNKLSTNIKI